MRELITLKLEYLECYIYHIYPLDQLHPKKRVAGATLAKPMGFLRLSR